MLVDPLAALFRPDLEGEPPLKLEITRVEVELLPPLARIAVTRVFINRSDSAIEAVLTLPPPASEEVVYGLTVTLGGVQYRASAAPRRTAARAHDDAAAQGRLAILHERLAHDVQLISIAGIAPMTTAEVRVESVRPLAWPGDDDASLEIALTFDPRRLNRGLLDAERLLTTADRGPATLTVTGDRVAVTVAGHDGPIPLGQPIGIDCAAPVAFGIAALDGRSLAQSSDRAPEPGGWEAVIDRPLETMAGGFEPVGFDASGLAGRSDWIAGRAAVEGVFIRVIAPSPRSEATPTAAARAMSAFAAAHLVDTATPATPAQLRLATNILDRNTALAFLGPEGEATGEMAPLRKLALPATSDGTALSPPLAPSPYADDEGPEAPRPPLPHPPDPKPPPGARPPASSRRGGLVSLGRAALALAPAGLVALWLLGATIWVPFPLGTVTIALFVALGLNAALNLPRAADPAQNQALRRLPWLLILAIPPLSAWLAGPFGLLPEDLGDLTTGRVIWFQAGCLAAAALAPLALLPAMRGGRRFTLDLGAITFVITFFAVSVAIITLSPGD